MAVKKRQKTLSHGRPPVSKPKERMTSERSRTIIRTHHRLQKEHAAALKKGDASSAQEIARAIEKNGGIKMYQAASKQGQAKDRGGDSSKLLVDWLQQSRVLDPKARDRRRAGDAELRCLEVGALSTKNEISKYASVIDMTRIDLNSQGPGIEKQDFMERPLPTCDNERFDIVSLSLVLNYVPDAVGRGEMLKRITSFLRKGTETADSVLPALFFVLPLPCIDNSRYLDEELFLGIMGDLGFTMRFSKNTSKLCYYLFTLTNEPKAATAEKRKIRDGSGMNNFCIVVE
ncbi:putative methyltransferase-domain-containing protein [Alternaria rosae]|uniref:putative methyltransferase-domain-containing protein n=1 Tax=Alternaria rosae TaxID=1187941 RepID=UPI001E8DC128|nr:putative methyltransferase-domain-containing protein [Alternaria rosae]KAH6866415.1 putative methyltransferase-domain-containing protein [Alternaria rosae]